MSLSEFWNSNVFNTENRESDLKLVRIRKLNRFSSVGILQIIRYCFLILHIVSLFYAFCFFCSPSMFSLRFSSLYFFLGIYTQPCAPMYWQILFFSQPPHIVFAFFTFSTCVLLFSRCVCVCFFVFSCSTFLCSQPISISADYLPLSSDLNIFSSYNSSPGVCVGLPIRNTV